MIKVNGDGAMVACEISADGELSCEEIGVTEVWEGPAYTEPEVTTMTEAKPNKGGHNNNYPFLTKGQIRERIWGDAGFAEGCLLVLYVNQTEDEREKKDTVYKNRRGFMSSHAVNGSNLALKILGGEGLTPEETGKVQAMASRYTTQLARHFRSEKLAADPGLAEKAACFFAGQ